MMMRIHSQGLFTLITKMLLPLSLLLSACSDPANNSATQNTNAAGPLFNAIIYEGARLIVGNGQVIENASFIVENGLFVAVGSTTAMTSAANAARVDLSGMTVMPGLIDTHVHLSTNRAALMDDLQNRARMGIVAAQSMGSDGPDTPIEIRDEIIPGAARYLTAGRGITSPEPGRSEVPHWVTTEEEARQAVRDEVARNVDLIKIWVDDRGGQYERLSPALYGAVIDEAHRNNLQVAAHIFRLEDAKGLLEAGIDIFAHGVRDQDIDDEFVEMVLARPNVVLIPNLPYRGVPTDLTWLSESMTMEAAEGLLLANIERPEVQEAFGIQARNLARLSEAGMTIAMGTDGNSYWGPHIEMEDMVASGMSPAEVIIAATNNSAELLGFEELGAVEAGKSADFIVLAANPLDDISNTRRIVDVYLRGENVPR
ncbi:MAG: amidohydrolase family protein [Gammaproteobacteria bacterium]|jgi:imidazolonepropionase-like amidohydrolase|nr:amidohydrolase family protein [Gammaproteobacteria bacterium]